MKLTISQEGANPITIRTRSAESAYKELRQEYERQRKEIQEEQEFARRAAITVGGIYGGAILLAIAKAVGYTIVKKGDLGSFASAKDMYNAPLFLQHFKRKVLSKYKPPYPSENEVKNDPKTKVKTSFLQKIFLGRFDKRLINQVGTSNLIFKVIEGVPVSICALTETEAGSLSGSGGAMGTILPDKKLLVATGYVYENLSTRKIKSVPICCGYLESNKQTRTATECADIHFDDKGNYWSKKDIIKKVREIRSSESSLSTNEVKMILDKFTL